MNDPLAALLELSHALGREDRRLSILGEGNTSARLEPGRLAVKASGCQLGNLTKDQLTTCHAAPLLDLLDRDPLSDGQIEQAMLDARTDSTALKPSIETMFHAWLLTLEGVNFVGHTHPVTVNQILCSPRAREFAERRTFPDEVVCCGPASVWVPYVDPGLTLAIEIRKRTNAFIERRQMTPRVILLENHGLIALGATPNAVLATTLMADKAAAIFIGAAALGGPVFMTEEQVQRIAGRADEAHRQRQLKMG